MTTAGVFKSIYSLSWWRLHEAMDCVETCIAQDSRFQVTPSRVTASEGKYGVVGRGWCLTSVADLPQRRMSVDADSCVGR
jgi:hypothetical protein